MMVTLADNVLTTLAAVQSELGVYDPALKDRLTRLINAASGRIEDFCNRSFYYEAARVDSVPGYGGTYLLVPKAPIISITEIQYAGVVVEDTDYEVHDANGGILYAPLGWIWTASATQEILSHPRSGSERKYYQVTYEVGWRTPQQTVDGETGGSALPDVIEDACLQLISSRYSRPNPNVKSERLMRWSVTYGDNEAEDGLPSSVAAMLRPYRRLVQA